MQDNAIDPSKIVVLEAKESRHHGEHSPAVPEQTPDPWLLSAQEQDDVRQANTVVLLAKAKMVDIQQQAEQARNELTSAMATLNFVVARTFVHHGVAGRPVQISPDMTRIIPIASAAVPTPNPKEPK